jgi:hypothetical protein
VRGGKSPRGRQALERGGDFVSRHLTLERDGDSPEGCRGPVVCGAAEAFWAVGLSLPWDAVVRCVFRGLFICLFVYFLSKWMFSPVNRGPLWLSPTHVSMTQLPMEWRRSVCVASRILTTKIPSVLLVAIIWLQHTRCPRFRRDTFAYGTTTSPFMRMIEWFFEIFHAYAC